MSTDHRNEYPAVAGHQLRHVVSERWGDLIAVGNTKMAYVRQQAAEQYAKDNALSYDQLAIEYRDWGVRENLVHLRLGSADEHLFDERLTQAQRLWLVEFCRRWESVAVFEAEMEEIRRGRT